MKRILMVGEASNMASGYSTYIKEVMSRLHKSGKYELAEFASYGYIPDGVNFTYSPPWKYYPNAVTESDKRYSHYNSEIYNQWGKWRFDRVLLDFKPHIVWTIRDYWMDSWIKTSPLREYFHWVWMPTIDSDPQQEEWINTFIDCDGVLTYSDYGLEVLKKQGGGKIKLYKSAPPGATLDLYKPFPNKKKHKADMGFDPNCLIIGTVMRNQKRKLFPELFQAFRQLLNTVDESISKRLYLYIHSSYPDAGWDFPLLIKEHGIGHRVICTYLCRRCNNAFAAFFQDAKTVCNACGTISAGLTNVGNGITQQQLATIYNLFDVYVQYAICEGFGMAQPEAAACGVHVMSVDYSAMSDIVRKLKGDPIRVNHLFREMETGAYRAYPDNNDLVAKLSNFFNQPAALQQRQGFIARKQAEQYYDWDKTAKIWEEYFDSVEGKSKWYKEPVLYDIPQQMPENLNNEQLADFIFGKVLNRPDLIDSYEHAILLKDLNLEAVPIADFATGRTKWKEISKGKVFKKYKVMAEDKVIAEKARVGMLQLNDEDYIQYANRPK